MPGFDWNAAINSALTASPELSNSPGLAIDVAQSADPSTTAPVVTQAATAQNVAQSVQEHTQTYNSGGLWSKIGGWIGHSPVGTVMNYMNKPLNEIQRDYKFIHALWADPHTNAGEAILATLGVIGGGVGGFILAGGDPLGAVAGADLVGSLERNTFGRFGFDSAASRAFADSNNPNSQISFGRDIASAVGQIPGLHTFANTNSGVGRLASGVGDMAFDFGMDPLIKAGKLSAVVRNGDLIDTANVAGTRTLIQRSYLGRHVPAIGNWLAAHSVQAINTDQVDLAWARNAAYKRALEQDLANKSEADIIAKYPDQIGIAPLIANKSAEDIHKVYREAFWQDGVMQNLTSSMLPQKTLMRVPFSKVADTLRTAGESDATGLTPGTWEYARATNARATEPGFVFPHKVVWDTGKSTAESGSGATATEVHQVPSVLQNAVRYLNPMAENPDALGLAQALQKKVRTFSGFMAFGVDKQGNLSTSTFDATDRVSASRALLSYFRYSMGESAARKMTTQAVNLLGNLTREDVTPADIKAFRVFLANSHVETLKAAGVPADADVMRAAQDAITDAQDFGGISGGDYGYGLEKKGAVSDVPIGDMDGPTRGAAIFSHQTSTSFTLPSFLDIRNSVRDANAYLRYYGKFDSFASHYITTPFKQMALATGGFALRIAASELLPEVMRNGGWSVVKSAIGARAAEMNYPLAFGEDEHVAAAMLALAAEKPEILDNAVNRMTHAPVGKGPRTALAERQATPDLAAELQSQPIGKSFGSVIRAADRLINNEEDRKLFATIVLHNGGHMVKGAVSTVHNGPNDLLEATREATHNAANRQSKRIGRKNPEWSTIRPGDSDFDGYWLTHLQKLSQDKPTQLILQDYKRTQDWDEVRRLEAERIRNAPHATPGDPYRHEYRIMTRYDDLTPEAQAFDRVDAIRGQLTSEFGDYWHQNLADKMARGEKPMPADIKNVRREQMPGGTIGHEDMGYIGFNLPTRIINEGYKRVIDPIINYLSRNSIYGNAVKIEMKPLKWLVDDGKIDYDQAVRIAQYRAVHRMIPQIHNTALRSQFSVLARNYMPFYFAQEQAFRRAGHLIAEYPHAFRDYQLAEQAINNPGFVSVDDQGNKRLVMPFSGALGNGLMGAMSIMGLGHFNVVGGLPVTMTGNIQSLQTVLPELNVPGVSPMVSIAANQLANWVPDLAPAISKVEGQSFGRSVIDELIPNSPLRNLFHALSPDEASTAYLSAVTSAMAAAYYHGDFPDASNKVEQQQFQDRIKNNARSIMIMKALLSTISPLSPSVSQDDLGPDGLSLRDEFFKLANSPKYRGNYIGALQAFLNEHGNKAISYVVAKSQSSVPGSYAPLTDEAFKWINAHGDLINQFPYAASYLMPQNGTSGGNAQVVYDEMVKMGLRARRTPQQFMDAIYVAAGNNLIAQASAEHKQLQQQLAGDPAALKLENQRWSQYIQSKIIVNPIWGADYQSPVRTQTAAVAYNQLSQVFQKNLAPDTQQTQITGDLMRAYQSFQMQYAAVAPGYGTTTQRTYVKDNWDAFLKQYATDHPEAATVINSLFSRLAA